MDIHTINETIDGYLDHLLKKGDLKSLELLYSSLSQSQRKITEYKQTVNESLASDRDLNKKAIKDLSNTLPKSLLSYEDVLNGTVFDDGLFFVYRKKIVSIVKDIYPAKFNKDFNLPEEVAKYSNASFFPIEAITAINKHLRLQSFTKRNGGQFCLKTLSIYYSDIFNSDPKNHIFLYSKHKLSDKITVINEATLSISFADPKDVKVYFKSDFNDLPLFDSYFPSSMIDGFGKL